MSRPWILDDPVLSTAGPIGRFFEKVEAGLSIIVVTGMSGFLSVGAVFQFIIPWLDKTNVYSPLAVSISMLVGVLGIVLIRVNWPIAWWTYHFLRMPRACVALSVVKVMRVQPVWVRYSVPLAAVAKPRFCLVDRARFSARHPP